MQNTSPKNIPSYDIIVIGAGAGGLTIAVGAAKAGKKVFLIEKRHYGGDCTNFGCIPSKALIASAKCAHTIRNAQSLGIQIPKIEIDGTNALARARKIVEQVRLREESETLTKLGIPSQLGTACFLDPHTLLIRESKERVRGKKIVIATGSHPLIPPIQGLEVTPYLTNETIFDLKSIPKSLFFLGGGPINCELAQTFSRIGSKVSILSNKPHLLDREDDDARNVLTHTFEKENIDLYLSSHLKKVKETSKGIAITIEKEEKEEEISCEHLFLGVGRKPNCCGLDLDRAQVVWNEGGILTDKYARTSQPHIYAIGDVTGTPFFTHRAENQARSLLQTLLFSPLKKKQNTQLLPRCTYTDPEIASIGLHEKEAKELYGEKKITSYTIPFSEIDRNITSGRTDGFLKITTKKWNSRILGATIVGSKAGEILMQISTALLMKIPLRKLSHLIYPYPIESFVIRKAADLWLIQTILPKIFSFIRK